jgi:predicted phosphodiesterase
MPISKFDGIIYGHFHTGFIEEKECTIIANAGSLSIPKNQTPSSYIILQEGKLTLKDENGAIIVEA